MKHDLRRPSIVIAGAWIPAIFNAGWQAVNIFDYQEGIEIDVEAIQETGPGGSRLIHFLRGTGISASNERVELFAREAKDVDSLEGCARRVVETLRHTPFAALGLNFRFIESDPEDVLVDKLKVQDGLTAAYKVKTQTFRTVIDVEKNVDLNLIVGNSTNAIAFDFNYHHVNFDLKGLLALLDGRRAELEKHALALMKAVYGLTEVEYIGFPQATNNKLGEGKGGGQ